MTDEYGQVVKQLHYVVFGDTEQGYMMNIGEKSYEQIEKLLKIENESNQRVGVQTDWGDNP